MLDVKFDQVQVVVGEQVADITPADIDRKHPFIAHAPDTLNVGPITMRVYLDGIPLWSDPR